MHDGADPRLDGEEALRRQVRDDLVRGVGIDAQFLAELPHRGETAPGLELALQDRLLHGVDHLFVNRSARLDLNAEGKHAVLGLLVQLEWCVKLFQDGARGGLGRFGITVPR